MQKSDNLDYTSLFRARAIDRAMLVFPTPEGKRHVPMESVDVSSGTWRPREAENLPLDRLV